MLYLVLFKCKQSGFRLVHVYFDLLCLTKWNPDNLRAYPPRSRRMLLHLTNGDVIATNTKPSTIQIFGASHETQWPKVQTQEHNYYSQTQELNDIIYSPLWGERSNPSHSQLSNYKKKKKKKTLLFSNWTTK